VQDGSDATGFPESTYTAPGRRPMPYVPARR